MAKLPSHAFEAAEIITKRIGSLKPRLGIVLGSGLGEVARQIKDPITISYDELPNFSVSRVAGQASKMHLGILHNVPIVCLEGRTHTYEGENCLEVIRTVIRTLKLIGCEILLTTNAVGSLNKEIGSGSLVLLKDHINFMFSNPLVGINDERFGERFVSMDNVYDQGLRQKILNLAKKLGISITEGVLIGTSGPSFETHAEIRAFKLLGADVVGMSTIPEVIVARHAGIKVVSLSAVTNLAAGLSDEILSHEGTLKGAKLACENLVKVILGFVIDLGEQIRCIATNN